MKCLKASVLALSSLFAFSLQAEGGAVVLNRSPFGFQCGMTAEQIIHLVGKIALKESQGDALTLATAPRPNSAFESYRLIISPEKGLLWMGGHAPRGVEGYDSFINMRKAVSRVYGAPGRASEDNSSGFRMAMWDLKSTLPNGVTAIVLDDLEDKDPLLLIYECDGFKTYLASKKANARAVAKTSK